MTEGQWTARSTRPAGGARSPARRSARRLARLLGHTDPVALTGIGLSVLLSVTLDVTGAATGVESLLAGLLGTTVSLLVDSIARAERRFELRTLMAGPSWLTDTLTPIAEGAREAAERYPDTPVAAEARRRLDQLRAETEQLRAGRIIRPGGDDRDLLDGARTCAGRLDAVANLSHRADGEPSWWTTDTGRRYWELNRAALARGVRITRVFGYQELTPHLRELVDEQRAAGVRVGLLPWGAVDRSLEVNLAVWDDTSAWEARMSPHGEISENIYTVNADDLRRLRHVYQTCVRAATFLD